MAHVAAIMAEGPTWFRDFGTDASPGTIVCTVSGPGVKHAGVGEYALGTPLQTIIHELGGGVPDGHEIVAVLPGVANPLVPALAADHPGDLRGPAARSAAGSGAARSSCSTTTPTWPRWRQGVSRFLAVESCGQCTPCKQDGVAISELLDRVRDVRRASPATSSRSASTSRRSPNSARCSLAEQHQRVVGSILRRFEPALRAHVRARPRSAAGRADPDRADRADRRRCRDPRRAPAAQAARLDASTRSTRARRRPTATAGRGPTTRRPSSNPSRDAASLSRVTTSIRTSPTGRR